MPKSKKPLRCVHGREVKKPCADCDVSFGLKSKPSDDELMTFEEIVASHEAEQALRNAMAIGMFVGPCITQRDARKAVKEWSRRPLKERVPYEKDAMRVLRALRSR